MPWENKQRGPSKICFRTGALLDLDEIAKVFPSSPGAGVEREISVLVQSLIKQRESSRISSDRMGRSGSRRTTDFGQAGRSGQMYGPSGKQWSRRFCRLSQVAGRDNINWLPRAPNDLPMLGQSRTGECGKMGNEVQYTVTLCRGEEILASHTHTDGISSDGKGRGMRFGSQAQWKCQQCHSKKGKFYVRDYREMNWK